MNYELKHFSESYLEKQFEIGNHHLSTWLGAQQTPVSRLRDIYSKENFDPETKFYALHNNEVVGFITATLGEGQSAKMEFPLILPGHEDAEEKLMEFAFTTLRKKGVAKVISRASPRWGKTMELANTYEYKKKELMWKNGRLDVKSYVQQNSDVDIKDVVESDYDEIRNILMSFRENTEQEAQKQVELLHKISERVTSWKIVRENNKMAGHDHLVQDIRDNKKARMNAIFATRDEIRHGIMNAHVQAAIKNGIQYIDIFFFGPTVLMDGPYLQYGFDISDLYAFEKSL